VREPRPRRNPAPALAAAALFALAAAALPAPAQTRVPRGQLSELKDRRRVALIVIRTHTVDARDPARAALDIYRKAFAGAPPRLHESGQRAVSRQLDKYIRKYGSMAAVGTVAESEFVVIFNVLRARRSFVPDEPYIYGKLFVIARPTVAGTPPRLVWESEDNDASVEDALGDFLKALKALRGEK